MSYGPNHFQVFFEIAWFLLVAQPRWQLIKCELEDSTAVHKPIRDVMVHHYVLDHRWLLALSMVSAMLIQKEICHIARQHDRIRRTDLCSGSLAPLPLWGPSFCAEHPDCTQSKGTSSAFHVTEAPVFSIFNSDISSESVISQSSLEI